MAWSPGSTETPAFDCIIVGGGLAGAAAASVLGRAGWRVAMIDRRAVYSPTFKAEKIEPDQAEILRRLGLLDGLLPHLARINEVGEAHGGRLLRAKPIEEYGAYHQEIVNAVRRQIPATVETRFARAVDATVSADLQSVTLDTGERLESRLLVLAAGTGGQLHETLGIQRRLVRACHSLSTGFDIAPTNGRPFPFQALTYFADSLDSRIDYVTLFVVPGRMRVNLFSYHDPKDPWVRTLVDAPFDALGLALPGLTRLIGEWRVTSKVESRPIDLYVAEPSLDGVVLVGDASQSVCPATGTGVSKVLTDVEVLCTTHLPSWLGTPGMPASKIATYYADPRKVACDRHSLEAAEHQRRFGTDRSFRWWVHRRRTFAHIFLGGLRDRLHGRRSALEPVPQDRLT